MVNIFNTIEEWKDELVENVAKTLGEILVSGTTLTLSFPEYVVDSLVQSLDPITDPFLVAIGPEQERAEYPSAYGFFGRAGSFWVIDFEQISSFTFPSRSSYSTETLLPFYFVITAELLETAMSFTFNTVGP